MKLFRLNITLILLFIVLTQITHASTQLDCVAYCLGKYTDISGSETNAGWIQVSGQGKNLTEVMEALKSDCQKKMIIKADELNQEYNSTYQFKSVGSIFTKYENGHVFLPKKSCLGI